MKCEKCGLEIPDGNKLCPNCGNEVGKKKGNIPTWVIVLFSLFLPPVGIFLLWYCKKPTGKIQRWCITVMLGCYTLMLISSLSSDSNIDSAQEAESTVAEENTADAAETAETGDEGQETKAENKKESKKKTKEKKNNKTKEKSKKDETTATEQEKQTEEKSETKEETLSKKEYIAKCKAYDYKKVLRNPDKYIGKKIKVKLQISSVHKKGILTPTQYYFAYSKSDFGWYGDEYAIYETREKEKPKLLEDDIVMIYGEIGEPEDTMSLIVQSSEVFVINMKYATLVKE